MSFVSSAADLALGRTKRRWDLCSVPDKVCTQGRDHSWSQLNADWPPECLTLVNYPFKTYHWLPHMNYGPTYASPP